MKAITFTRYIKSAFFMGAMLLTTCAVVAQDEEADDEKKFSFSGSVDAYYRTNLGAPNDEDAISPGSSFANQNGFAIGMANIIAAYEGEKVGFVADLVFGPRGADATFLSGTDVDGDGQPDVNNVSNIVNQLYVYWNLSDAVTLTFGNFNTYLGYEVISPVANFNYSTSYLFSYGPFSHTGLRADFALSEDFSLMLAVMNPTDATEFNPTGDYAAGAQLGYSDQYLNFLYNDGGYEIDYTGGFNLSEDFFLGLNAAYFDNNDDNIDFAGVALYPQYTTSENFAIGLRGEYFTETNVGAIGAADADGEASVFALTLTGSATIGGLIIKPELRLDSASEDAFVNSDGEPVAGLSSFLLAAIYSF
ncbi:MAG: porin [Pricia sp.]